MNRDDFLDLYFRELDLGPRWRRRGPPAAGAGGEGGTVLAQPVVTLQENLGNATTLGLAPSAGVNQGEAQLRTASTASASAAAAGISAAGAADGQPAAISEEAAWATLESTIRGCQACALCRQRRQAVPGVGDRRAEWLFIGEGPGAEEDQKGEPFVGQAGKLLDNMLAAIGLERGNKVYIGNAVKCRPPNNRTPEAGEIAACGPFLARQIELIRPKLIVVLGRVAATSVLGGDEPLGSLRGRVHRRGDIPVVVTYHPAYLLRTPMEKAKAWEDLCLARRTMCTLQVG